MVNTKALLGSAVKNPTNPIYNPVFGLHAGTVACQSASARARPWCFCGATTSTRSPSCGACCSSMVVVRPHAPPWHEAMQCLVVFDDVICLLPAMQLQYNNFLHVLQDGACISVLNNLLHLQMLARSL